MARPECSIDGCDRTVAGRGLCSPHYQRLREHGDPQADIPIMTRSRREATPPVCTIAGCGRPHTARGMCSVHYYRWRQSGEIGAPEAASKVARLTVDEQVERLARRYGAQEVMRAAQNLRMA
jgi:hypothetical protein